MKIFDVVTAKNREKFYPTEGVPWLELEDMRSSDPAAPFEGGGGLRLNFSFIGSRFRGTVSISTCHR
ncbi:hypothetical protein KEM60_03180 [Austwickia sp. TVS 96-490-7B]|nr:hypothetical protein [Austwickia sp. TVS 96-490-7B]